MYLNQSAAVSTTAKRGEVHLVQLPQGQTQAVDVGWNCRPLRKIKVRGNNLVSARANLRFTQVRDSKLSLSLAVLRVQVTVKITILSTKRYLKLKLFKYAVIHLCMVFAILFQFLHFSFYRIEGYDLKQRHGPLLFTKFKTNKSPIF